MKPLKRTPWFPPEIKPVWVGWYERQYLQKHLTEMPDFWTGNEWLEHYYGRFNPSHLPRPWRGLTEPA